MDPLRQLEHLSRIEVWRGMMSSKSNGDSSLQCANHANQNVTRPIEIAHKGVSSEVADVGKESACSPTKTPSLAKGAESSCVGSAHESKQDKPRATEIGETKEGNKLATLTGMWGIEAPVSDALLRVLPKVLPRSQLSRILVLFHRDSAQDAVGRPTLWDLVREKGYHGQACLAG